MSDLDADPEKDLPLLAVCLISSPPLAKAALLRPFDILQNVETFSGRSAEGCLDALFRRPPRRHHIRPEYAEPPPEPWFR
jgi:hypothetical protein